MRRFDLHALLVALFLALSPSLAAAEDFYFGADLSYVNEMEDCGAQYRMSGAVRDPYEIFRDTGHNLVRLRLFHTPDWTQYSTLDDVKRSIRRARAAGMQVLLDFHYSDDWADGDKQWIPRAWENIATTEALAQAVYDYTLDTLRALDSEGLMPEMVQVGNETNREVLGRRDWDWANRPIDWTRNAALLNAGIRAVREAGRGAATPASGDAARRAARERRALVRRRGAGRRHRFRSDRHFLLSQMVDARPGRPGPGHQPPAPSL